MRGELVVTGSSSFEVLIDKAPTNIIVEFTDEPEPIPCNPFEDTLHWSFHKIYSGSNKSKASQNDWSYVVGNKVIKWFEWNSLKIDVPEEETEKFKVVIEWEVFGTRVVNFVIT